jgi:hypothetical protein
VFFIYFANRICLYERVSKTKTYTEHSQNLRPLFHSDYKTTRWGRYTSQRKPEPYLVLCLQRLQASAAGYGGAGGAGGAPAAARGAGWARRVASSVCSLVRSSAWRRGNMRALNAAMSSTSQLQTNAALSDSGLEAERMPDKPSYAQAGDSRATVRDWQPRAVELTITAGCMMAVGLAAVPHITSIAITEHTFN